MEEIPIGLPDELQLALELRKLHVYRESWAGAQCVGVYEKVSRNLSEAG